MILLFYWNKCFWFQQFSTLKIINRKTPLTDCRLSGALNLCRLFLITWTKNHQSGNPKIKTKFIFNIFANEDLTILFLCFLRRRFWICNIEKTGDHISRDLLFAVVLSGHWSNCDFCTKLKACNKGLPFTDFRNFPTAVLIFFKGFYP